MLVAYYPNIRKISGIGDHDTPMSAVIFKNLVMGKQYKISHIDSTMILYSLSQYISLLFDLRVFTTRILTSAICCYHLEKQELADTF